MERTAVEKILMKHSVDPVDKIFPGDIITARIDYAGVHEGVTRQSSNNLVHWER